jgi:hypothetical protein
MAIRELKPYSPASIRAIGRAPATADEYLRERVVVAVQRSIERVLREPNRPTLEEATRRLPNWKEGRAINLANGQDWTFPEVDLSQLDLVAYQRRSDGNASHSGIDQT